MIANGKCKVIALIEPNEVLGNSIIEVVRADSCYKIHWIQKASEIADVLEAKDIWPPDLLILDISRMAGEYGKQLRRLFGRGTGIPPVILMSEYPTSYIKGIVSKNDTLESQDVIVKPFDMENLLSSIQYVFRDKEVVQDVEAPQIVNIATFMHDASLTMH